MTKLRLAQLQAAIRRKQLVRFTRPFEEGHANGYIQAIGSQWFMLALVDDNIWFNGFQCFRLKDVRRLQVPNPYAQFVEAALRKRNAHFPRRPRVSIANIEDLLRTANRAFSLVTIHREQVNPNDCWIGQILDLDKKRVTLLEISPDACWDKEPTDYRLAEITRVDFGGDYEDALFSVGGKPPSILK
jgi:hypothetical protein